ncbi:MAG: hypothetical protein ACLR7U_11520 [Ruthenibacterium lactatiformans]
MKDGFLVLSVSVQDAKRAEYFIGVSFHMEERPTNAPAGRKDARNG